MKYKKLHKSLFPPAIILLILLNLVLLLVFNNSIAEKIYLNNFFGLRDVIPPQDLQPFQYFNTFIKNFIIASFTPVIMLFAFCLLFFFKESVQKWGDKQYFAFSVFISLFLLSSLLFRGPTNIEEYAYGVVSALVRIQYLFEGQILLWSDGRGFGFPMPTVPTTDTHPLFLLSPVVSLRIIYSTYWILHVSLGCYYFIKICRILGISNSMSIISGYFYVFSTVNIDTANINDWPFVLLVFNMFPLIVYYSFKILLDENNILNSKLFILSILFAFTIYNGHSSSYLHYYIILGIGLMYYIYLMKEWKKFKLLFVVFFITSILVSPRIYHIIYELSLFPPNIKAHAGTGYHLLENRGYISNFAPIFDLSPQLEGVSNLVKLNKNIINSISEFNLATFIKTVVSNFRNHSMRSPFVGLVYFVFSFYSIRYFLFHKSNDKRKDSLVQTVYLMFFVSFISTFTPADLFFDTITTKWLRDEYIFCSIILSAYAIDHFKQQNFIKNNYWIFIVVIAFQFFQHLGYTGYWTFFHKWNHKQSSNITNFFQRASDKDKLYMFLLNSKNKYGNRVLLSPLIENDLNDEQPLLGREKLYSIADINLVTDINVINDNNLKGISLNTIYKSGVFTKGWIKSDYDYFNNKAMLNIAGVNWVLLKLSEYLEYGPFPKLKEKDRFNFEWKDETWVLLHNSDAWKKSILLNNDVIDQKINYRSNCGHKGFLCADVEPLIEHLITSDVNLSGGNGNVELSIAPQNENVVIGLSTMYRSEWEAYSNGKQLNVFPLFGAFIGIEVPPGVTNINLDYLPKTRIYLMYLSLIALIFSFFAFMYYFVKGKKLKDELSTKKSY